MSKEVAVLSSEEIAALAYSLGASSDDLQGGGGNFLPALKVWLEEDGDDDDAPRLKGKMYVTDQEPLVFAKPGTVRFRPLTHAYQWTKWDDAAKKTVNRTRLIFSFREEARDELGTLKCGKPLSRELRDNPNLAKLYEDITTWRRVQGLVSYTGVTADGKEVEVENLLVGLNLKGANFSPFDDEFIRVMPRGTNLWDFETKIDLTREKNGSVTYYVMHFEPDFSNPVPLTVEVFDTIKALKADIDEINKEIDKKYYDALNRKSSDDDVAEAVGFNRPSANRGLEADLEIPF